jgi:hypothetical protein
MSDIRKTKQNKKFKTLKGSLSLFPLVILLSIQWSPSVFALDNGQQEIYNEGINFFDLNIDSGTCGSTGGTITTLTGSDNEQQTWNYFKTQGLSDAQTAGAMGNIEQESSFDPEIMEIGGDSQNPADAGSEGYGIVQWTPGTDVITDAKSYNITTPIYELVTQLNIVWGEMNGTSPPGVKNMVKGLEQINDPSQAADYFEETFESTKGGGDLPQREDNAKNILKQYGGSGGGSSSGPTATTGCGDSVDCSGSSSASAPTTGSTTTSTSTPASGDGSGLSQTRQQVVCIAEAELALWKSQPGYPTPAYSETGYKKYTQGRAEEWCADFASWVYNQAGYSFQSSDWDLPAVSSIQSVGEQNKNFHWHPEGSNYTPRPGDLAIHGGEHVNIFISTSGGTTTYIGGDQGQGPYPGGSIVSIETGSGYYDNGITGYVSPD